MDEIEKYLAKLKKRYRRLFMFDRFLSVVLALSSGISLYGFFHYDGNKIFHLAGAASTVLVAFLVFQSNQLLLKNEKRGRKIAYIATVLFVFFRLSAPVYAMWTLLEPFGGLRAQTLWNLAPAMFLFLFFVGAYRGIYHLAAHNYVKIFIERKRAEKGESSSPEAFPPSS
ncbi:hypothetical protein QEH56_10890 [Pelagicoccus enzymogenes]|uniref:hypothetical protein n=1 Tax=Pelagicoccus enzymogenes TaxID=2773457 RepID=UPI00281058E7|nr:hypothetical protein [Pelagicoccus enzymogenes]MDQ8198659.1 hypothetical protein [Pelagicoccus enzymogenes]